jgi:RNA polymerase sigma-32 factor
METSAFEGMTATSASGLWQTARNAPILSAEAERNLAYAAQRGCKRSFDTLLRSHFRLVLAIAREHRSFGLSFDELVSEGLLGLVEAARRFDPQRGVRLAAYAVWWIRAHIRRYAVMNRRIVRAPSSRHGRKLLAGLRHTQRRLTQENGEAPTPEMVAEALGVTVRDVREMEAALSGHDLPCSGHADDAVQIAADEPTPEAIVLENQEEQRSTQAVRDALEQLSARERQIVERRYLSSEVITLASIGRRFGISRERVRQLEQRAFDRIREAVAV